MPSSERLLRGDRRSDPPAEVATPARDGAVIRSVGRPAGIVRHGSGRAPAHPSPNGGSPSDSPRAAGVDQPVAYRPADHGRRPARAGLDPIAAADLRAVHELAERRGHAAGSTRARLDVADLVAAAGELAAQLEAELPRDGSTLANLVATLALTVAGRILEAEVADDPARLVAVLERAIATVNGSPEVRVLLHPAAVRPIREAWEATHGTAWLGKTWHFEADRSLPPGGCLLRYHHGFVDAGIEAQLRAVGDALDGRITTFVRRAVPEAVQ